MRILLLALLLGLLGAVAYAEAPAIEDVSLVRILADPGAFDGKKVRTYGFAVFEFENSALYLSQETQRAGIYKNAIWIGSASLDVDLSRLKPNRKHIGVEGVFRAGDQGHMSLFSGTIEEISRVFILHDAQ